MLTIYTGDALTQLSKLDDCSVHCCVTSPPYYGLRDYGVDGQVGLEDSPEAYVAALVDIFREVRRVLRSDGTCWVNLGDSYAGGMIGRNDTSDEYQSNNLRLGRSNGSKAAARPIASGYKPKDLLGIPWQVAFALRADGWYLRSEIIWHKPNPMPESVTDRPTKSHEQVFLLAKSARYFYDSEAIKEQSVDPINSAKRYEYAFSGRPEGSVVCPDDDKGQRYAPEGMRNFSSARNRRSVWTIATAPYSEAHFATFPPKLVEPCILAGTSARGCCGECGAPWERVVERGETMWQERKDEGEPMRAGEYSRTSVNSKLNGKRHNEWKANHPDQTTGWQPTCKHISVPIPCTVLDPFAGSGTVGKVALELGRKAVLIELNPKYVEMIQRRSEVTLGLPGLA